MYRGVSDPTQWLQSLDGYVDSAEELQSEAQVPLQGQKKGDLLQLGELVSSCVQHPECRVSSLEGGPAFSRIRLNVARLRLNRLEVRHLCDHGNVESVEKLQSEAQVPLQGLKKAIYSNSKGWCLAVSSTQSVALPLRDWTTATSSPLRSSNLRRRCPHFTTVMKFGCTTLTKFRQGPIRLYNRD